MVITPLGEVAPRDRRVAVGMFDGVHVGHREVIRGSDTVVTFDPHPLAVLRPGAAPPLLTSVTRRAELAAGLGVRELVVLPFDRGLANCGARAFVDDVLVGRLRARRVAVGHNFHYGARGEGDPAALAADGRFDAHVVPLVALGGRHASSSRIRRLVAAGEMEAAAAFLGAPFQLQTRVARVIVPGHEALLALHPRYVQPVPGHYACRADGVPATVRIDAGRPGAAHLTLAGRPDTAAGRTELCLEFRRRLGGAVTSNRRTRVS